MSEVSIFLIGLMKLLSTASPFLSHLVEINMSKASLPKFSALRRLFFIFSDGKTPFDIHTNSSSENGFINVFVSTVFNEETASSFFARTCEIFVFCCLVGKIDELVQTQS